MAQESALRRQRAAVERAWARRVPTRASVLWAVAGAPEPRAEVAQSWMRSLRTVDPAQDSAPTANDADVRAQWSTSPLRGPVLQLADELRTIADDAGYVAAVTDESGTILWSCGGRVMRRRAERVNFAPGARWDEPHMGTNALSLALRSGRPSTVFSAEHLVAALHGWVCYCAPIHDPRGRMARRPRPVHRLEPRAPAGHVHGPHAGHHHRNEAGRFDAHGCRGHRTELPRHGGSVA